MGRWPNKYVIGLTGNIGVGKSVVRQMLQHLGAYTVDADGLTHQAMSPGAPAYKPIVETFGQLILNPDKSINRGALGNIVFSNKDAMSKLEAITHPIISGAINTLVGRAKQPIVVIEAIKLLEGDLASAVDSVWVVNAQPKTQYMRLVGKRKMSQEDAKQRILGQNSQAEKMKAAHVVINNDGNIEETWKQVQAAFNTIPKQEVAAAPPPPPPAQSATPQPAPAAQPTTPAPAKPAASLRSVTPPQTNLNPVTADTSAITVKRGMPSNADAIAAFINSNSNKDLGRMDIIMSFGQKSYLLAQDKSETTIGVIGWQVENLITHVDELYMVETGDMTVATYALIKAIEEASTELQSEVSFIYLPQNASETLIQSFLASNYELTTLKEIRIPAWREAVQEVMVDGYQILTKKLRKDRVLKPM